MFIEPIADDSEISEYGNRLNAKSKDKRMDELFWKV